MDKKSSKTLKKIIIKICYPMIILITKIMYQIDGVLLHNIIKTISFVPFVTKIKKRKIALNNLNIAFPHKKTKEHINIYRSSLLRIALNGLEFAFIASKQLNKNAVLDKCTVEGLEILDRAVKSGKGIILLSAHIGNFPLAYLWLAAKGYPVSIVFKEMKNYIDENFYYNLMQHYDIHPITYQKNTRVTKNILSALGNGKIVILTVDQKGNNNIPVKMFDRQVRIFPGAAVLARKTGLPIIPVFTHRQGIYHKIDILKPIELKTTRYSKQDIIENTQSMIDTIESYIKEYPEEWLWSYYRWH